MALVRHEIDRDRRLAVVTLADVDRRNAFTMAMVGEIAAIFDDLERDDGVGAVVVTGEAPAFCAGADLSHLGSSTETGLRDIYEGFLRVARCPLPTVAAVNGAAVGAGMNLALACDLRVAGASARFDSRFLQLGLHPGGGHTWMLERLTGPQTTAAMVLFGEVLDGKAAEHAGLVWKCVADGDLLETATELAASAATAPPDLARRMKATLRRIPSVSEHADAVDVELEPQVWSVGQPAFAERLANLQSRISRR